MITSRQRFGSIGDLRRCSQETFGSIGGASQKMTIMNNILHCLEGQKQPTTGLRKGTLNMNFGPKKPNPKQAFH